MKKFIITEEEKSRILHLHKKLFYNSNNLNHLLVEDSINLSGYSFNYPTWVSGDYDNYNKNVIQYILASQTKFDKMITECLSDDFLKTNGIEIVDEPNPFNKGSFIHFLTKENFDQGIVEISTTSGEELSLNMWDIANPDGEYFKHINKEIKINGVPYSLRSDQFLSFEESWQNDGNESILIRLCKRGVCSKADSIFFDGEDCSSLVNSIKNLNPVVPNKPIVISNNKK